MKLDLKTPLKTLKGDTRKHLIVRPYMRVKQTKLARELATMGGKFDSDEYAYHLAASMVEDFTYEDIMEMDCVDHQALDRAVLEIQYPHLKEEREAREREEAKTKKENGSADDPKGSTPNASFTKSFET